MKNTDDLLSAFEASVLGDEIRGMAEETAESIADALPINEVVKEIPIIKYLSGAYNIYNAICEKKEREKLFRFLYELRNVSDQDRIKFLKDLDDRPKYKKKTFERVLLIIQRLDESEKATILGKLFKNRMLFLIDQDTFFRLCFAVEHCFLDDIKMMHEVHVWNSTLKAGTKHNIGKEITERIILKSLSQLGLMDEHLVNDDQAAEIARKSGHFNTKAAIKHKYRNSKLGQDLIKFGF